MSYIGAVNGKGVEESGTSDWFLRMHDSRKPQGTHSD